MTTKRKVEEFDVCDIKESGSTIVHGGVTELSPMKKSKKDEKLEVFQRPAVRWKEMCACHLL